MEEIEDRLRSLGHPPSDAPSPDEIRRRVGRRRTGRRRTAGGAAALALVVGAVAAIVVVDRDGAEDLVTTGPEPTATGSSTSVTRTTASTTTTSMTLDSRTIGAVEDVQMSVAPQTDLVDGEVVEVVVDGLENLPDAFYVQCAGDVTADQAIRSCDINAVQQPPEVGQVAAELQKQVSVARFIDVARDPGSSDVHPYDCATEPAGCVLAVAPLSAPIRAVLVPIEFRDVATASPTASVEPSFGVQPGETVAFTVEGVRPNGSFYASVCARSPDTNCDFIRDGTPVVSDASGSISGELTVPATIYGSEGRTDCTEQRCAVALLDGIRLVEAPLTFAEDNFHPSAPRLQLEPGTPLVDGQEVTVTGEGFPPGVDIADQIGQCPRRQGHRRREAVRVPVDVHRTARRRGRHVHGRADRVGVSRRTRMCHRLGDPDRPDRGAGPARVPVTVSDRTGSVIGARGGGRRDGTERHGHVPSIPWVSGSRNWSICPTRCGSDSLAGSTA